MDVSWMSASTRKSLSSQLTVTTLSRLERRRLVFADVGNNPSNGGRVSDERKRYGVCGSIFPSPSTHRHTSAIPQQRTVAVLVSCIRM